MGEQTSTMVKSGTAARTIDKMSRHKMPHSFADGFRRNNPHVRCKINRRGRGEHRERESTAGDLLREMTREPNADATTDATAAEISRLIPTSRATFCVFGDRMRHQPTDRKNDQCSRNLGNKNN